MVLIARICLLLVLAGLLTPAIEPASAQPSSQLGVNSKRYIVIDAATGHVFAQRGADEQVAIASVTKVFTALQAMEMAPVDTPITTTDYDLRAPGGEYFGTSGTLMGFRADQTFTLEDMLYGMLLPSGNDASNAIARSLGGQPGDSDAEAVQRFMDLVNQRIADMGLTNTHLMNPHGWGVDGHYSSAADVAAFTRLVLNYPRLMDILGERSYTTSNGAISVTNTNRSLGLFPSVIAGKTGYDWDSGYCLMNVAQRGDVQIIAVTLDGIAPNDWYNDSAVLLDYGFEQQAVVAAAGGAFEGDVVVFTDPSAAQVARSVQPSSLVSIAARRDTPSSGVSQQLIPNPDVEPPAVVAIEIPDPLGASDAWVAAGIVVFLVGLQGLVTFRRFQVTPPRAIRSAVMPSTEPGAELQR